MGSTMVPSFANTSTPPPSKLVNEVRGSKLGLCNVRVVCVGPTMARGSVEPRFGSLRGGGGAVLERPSFDQSQFDPSTLLQEGGDIGRLKDRRGTGSGDSYRVLLLDDERHTENLVAKVLPQAVPSVTPDDARKLFSVSRQDGVAVVIVTVKEHAEFYCQMMIRGGLRSSIEPDSDTV